MFLSLKKWLQNKLPGALFNSILFKPVHRGSIGRVSIKPHIFFSSYYGSRKYPFGFLHLLAFSLITKKVTWILICTWIMDDDNSKKCFKDVSCFLRLFRRHKVIILANTLEEEITLRNAGLNAIHCSHNCFIDEQVFRPFQETSKIFQAIYDGRLSPYKRFELATKINDLAIITYKDVSTEAIFYGNEIKRLLKNVTWLNWSDKNNYKNLSPKDVNLFINQSKVGLCLSAAEGAMYASIQYLLAGIPVVTTHNLGGRDEFFDPEYVEWVDDNPSAVAEGVQKLINKNIDPDYIRRKTLDKVAEHRKRFISLIQSIFDENNINRHFEAEWDIIFSNKMQDSLLTWRKIFGSQKS